MGFVIVGDSMLRLPLIFVFVISSVSASKAVDTLEISDFLFYEDKECLKVIQKPIKTENMIAADCVVEIDQIETTNMSQLEVRLIRAYKRNRSSILMLVRTPEGLKFIAGRLK